METFPYIYSKWNLCMSHFSCSQLHECIFPILGIARINLVFHSDWIFIDINFKFFTHLFIVFYCKMIDFAWSLIFPRIFLESHKTWWNLLADSEWKMLTSFYGFWMKVPIFREIIAPEKIWREIGKSVEMAWYRVGPVTFSS